MSTLQVNRIIPLTGDSVYIQGAVIDSASFALTSSLSYQAVSSSYAGYAVSSSYAVTSSYASTVGVNFQQISPASTWVITHNLGNQHPLVQVYDTNHDVLIPQTINGLNTNTVVVTFSVSLAGYARVV